MGHALVFVALFLLTAVGIFGTVFTWDAEIPNDQYANVAGIIVRITIAEIGIIALIHVLRFGVN